MRDLYKLDCKLNVLTETQHHAIMRDLSRTYSAHHELESDFVITVMIMRALLAGLTSLQSHISSSRLEPSCRWWTPHMTSTILHASPAM